MSSLENFSKSLSGPTLGSSTFGKGCPKFSSGNVFENILVGFVD